LKAERVSLLENDKQRSTD